MNIDIFNEIFSHLLTITDIRNLSRTCKTYYNICSDKIVKLQNEYNKKYSNVSLLQLLKPGSKELFTFELVINGYYDLIPEAYYSKDNKVMCAALALQGTLPMLEYARSKHCPITEDCANCAAFNNHIDILKWLFMRCI